MTTTGIETLKSRLLMDLAKSKNINPLNTIFSDLDKDTKSQTNLDRTLGEALSEANSPQIAGIMHDHSQSSFRDELNDTRRSLAKRVDLLSKNVDNPLIRSREANDTSVNGINSAFQQLMRVLQTLVSNNIIKLDRVLNLPNPVEA